MGVFALFQPAIILDGIVNVLIVNPRVWLIAVTEDVENDPRDTPWPFLLRRT